MANRVVEILVTVKDEALGFFGKLGEAVGSVKDNLFTLQTAIEAFVGSEILKGGWELVNMFAELDMTIVRVNASLQVSGRYTKEGSEEIQRMAATMQDLTTVSRLAALEVSATVGALARELSPQQLAEVQKAAIGLSETFGISLERAASLIGRTLEGSFNALHRYGIEIDMSGSQQDRFNQLFSKTAPLFQIATEAADTLAGHIAQAKNQFAELERTAGEVIARFLGLGEKTGWLRDKMKELNDDIRAHGLELVAMMREWVDRLALLFDVIRVPFEAIRGVVSAVVDLFRDLPPLLTSIRDVIVDVFTHNFEKGAHDLIIFRNSWGQLSQDMKDDADPVIAAWDAVGDRLIKIGQDQINLDNMRKSGRTGLPPIGAQEHPGIQNVAGAGPGTTIEEELAHETAVVKDLREQHALLEAQYKSGTISETEYTTRRHDLLEAIKTEEINVYDLTNNTVGLKQHTQALTLLTQLETTAFQLQNDTLLVAQAHTRGLTDAERLLEEEYKTGIINLDQFLKKRDQLARMLEAEIVVVKALIASHQLTNVQMAEAIKLLDELETALGKVTGAAKSVGDQLREALGAGTTKPIQEMTSLLVKSAQSWEDAWTKSAGAAIALGKNVGHSIGEGIRAAAKHEQKLAVADALKYTAHGIFDVFFNPAQAAADFEAAAMATAAAVAYSAIAGGATDGGGGKGGGGGGGGGGGARSTTDTLTNAGAGSMTLVVNPGFTNDPVFVDSLMGFLEQATGRRVTVQAQG